MSKRKRDDEKRRSSIAAAPVSLVKPPYVPKGPTVDQLVSGNLDRARAAIGLSNSLLSQARTTAGLNDPLPKVVAGKNGVYRASVADRFFSSRVEHPAGRVPTSSNVLSSDAARTDDPMGRRKPGEFVTKARGVQARADLMPTAKEVCLSANRPKNTQGDGNSRPFVPWCQKGKGK